jgi:predicted RNase H-like nuclease (RuvC/YqgF family)
MLFCIPCYSITEKIALLEQEVEHLQRENEALTAKLTITEQSVLQLCRYQIEQMEARLKLSREQAHQKNASMMNNETIIEAIIPQTKTISILGSYLYQWIRKDKT